MFLFNKFVQHSLPAFSFFPSFTLLLSDAKLGNNQYQKSEDCFFSSFKPIQIYTVYIRLLTLSGFQPHTYCHYLSLIYIYISSFSVLHIYTHNSRLLSPFPLSFPVSLTHNTHPYFHCLTLPSLFLSFFLSFFLFSFFLSFFLTHTQLFSFSFSLFLLSFPVSLIQNTHPYFSSSDSFLLFVFLYFSLCLSLSLSLFLSKTHTD
ncbi:unnamed protein product [Acanthosepion pharaonis]|uniref:Uncharacterized protein n=1 Tax=Acanthosepion pharaonis TaxID=158019 RepID=A0A812CTF0_ACAPH|nr:unnamed protein product [Sepia pharaonis]